MGKGTIKVKRKCCRSVPACKSCPIVVLREVLKDAKAKDARKAAKQARKNGDGSVEAPDAVQPHGPGDKEHKSKAKKDKGAGKETKGESTQPGTGKAKKGKKAP